MMAASSLAGLVLRTCLAVTTASHQASQGLRKNLEVREVIRPFCLTHTLTWPMQSSLPVWHSLKILDSVP